MSKASDPLIEQRNREIVALAKRRVPPGEIVTHLRARGRSLNASIVYAVLGKARRAGEEVPRFAPSPGAGRSGVRYCTIPAAHMEALEAAAKRRNTGVRDLCGRILATVAAEDLFDAVLDDGQEANS